jgi:predicted nucleic acid-binding protein
MTAVCFVDTNVLVYARDASEATKQPLAREWLDTLWLRGCGRTGFQVLSEYYVTVTQKLDPGLEPAEAWEDVEDLFAWDPVRIDAALMKHGKTVATRYALSWWDALVVAAARASGSGYLLTEDLHDGQVLDGIRVMNPFRSSVEAIFAPATDTSRTAPEDGLTPDQASGS